MPARIGSAVHRPARSSSCRKPGHLPMRLINRTPSRSGWLCSGHTALRPVAGAVPDQLYPAPGDQSQRQAAAQLRPDERGCRTPRLHPGQALGRLPVLAGHRPSLKRLGSGLAIAAVAGLCRRRRRHPAAVRCAAVALLTVLSMVPPLAILPILFIVFGLGESCPR